ncbi:NACHT domain-containing protein [Lentzea sp. NPDC051208]|uniref:NACHT domain-containing protein n=1 Tax=Lentzea sp. NPDC051208 TaxID=3154642 RepID=UPI003428FC3F
MTAIATVVAELAETAVRWVTDSPVPVSALVRRRIEDYLRGPDCASLLELLCQLDYTEEGKFHQKVDRGELAEAFRREFQRAVRRETTESEEFASSLWAAIEQNAPYRTVDSRDRIRIKVTGPDRPIAERLGLASDVGRLATARATGSVIRAAMARAYDRMVMPHSKADFRFPIDRIYVPRKLRLDDAPIAEDEVGDRRFVLVGNPGAGKSTFMRRLLHRAVLVPLLVQLKQHQKLSNDFVTIIAEELRPLVQRAVDVQHVADLLDAGEAVVVFDGLDEVGDIQARRSAVAAIEAFAARFPLARIVVTCRQESYPVAKLDSTSFPVYWLPDFDADQVMRYVRTWFALVYAESRVEAFLRDSEHLADLRSNPLMLSLLCMLYQSEGYIPENTADVYRECSELMLVRWDAVSQVPSVIRSVKLAKFLVQELAQHFFFTLDGRGDEGEKTLERLVVAHLSEREEEDSQSYHQKAREFLDYCAERAWVLTQVDTSLDGERRFGFTHRTFMEYYTACYVLRTCDTADEIVRVLLPMLTSGKSFVVPQIALQMYDVNRADGGDACVRLLLAMAGDEVEVLTFCVSFLEHNNLRRATVEVLLEHAFAALGRTGDGSLYHALRATRHVKRTRTATVARAVLARTTADLGSDLRLGAGLVVRVPSVSYEVALGEERHGLRSLNNRFEQIHGAAAWVYASLPKGSERYVPGPMVKCVGDGCVDSYELRRLAVAWPDVMPIPASVLPSITSDLDRADLADAGSNHVGARAMIAMIAAAAFEGGLSWSPLNFVQSRRPALAEALMRYCGDESEVSVARDLLERWGRAEAAFVDTNR